jgi:hypothetical protein
MSKLPIVLAKAKSKSQSPSPTPILSEDDIVLTDIDSIDPENDTKLNELPPDTPELTIIQNDFTANEQNKQQLAENQSIFAALPKENQLELLNNPDINQKDD